MNIYDKLNKDHPVDNVQIKTSLDYCKEYYNELFKDLDNQIVNEYKKLNEKFYSVFFILAIGVLFLIGVSIITPIFVWPKSHSIISIITLVICGIVGFIIVCVFALDLISKYYSIIKEVDEKWSEIYTTINTNFYEDTWSCTCYDTFIDTNWINKNIVKQLIENNVSDTDIANIAQWTIFESDGKGKSVKEYINNNYNIIIDIEDNIDLFDIIEKMYGEKENQL